MAAGGQSFSIRNLFGFYARRWGLSSKHVFQAEAKGAFGQSVFAVIHYVGADGQRKILTTYRSDEHESYVKAGMTGKALLGGMVDKGEHPFVALRREIIEEIAGDMKMINKQRDNILKHVLQGGTSPKDAQRIVNERISNIKAVVEGYEAEVEAIIEKNKKHFAKLIQRSLMRPLTASGWDATIDSVYAFEIEDEVDAKRLADISSEMSKLMVENGIVREVEAMTESDLDDTCSSINDISSDPEAIGIMTLQHWLVDPDSQREELARYMIDENNLPNGMEGRSAEIHHLIHGEDRIVIDPDKAQEMWDNGYGFDVFNNGVRKVSKERDGKIHLEVLEPDVDMGQFVEPNPSDRYPFKRDLHESGYYFFAPDVAPDLVRKRAYADGQESQIRAVRLQHAFVVPGIHDTEKLAKFNPGDWLILEKKEDGTISVRGIDQELATHSFSIIEPLNGDRRRFSEELLAEEKQIFAEIDSYNAFWSALGLSTGPKVR